MAYVVKDIEDLEGDLARYLLDDGSGEGREVIGKKGEYKLGGKVKLEPTVQEDKPIV